MLKGISPVISPDLIKIFMEMGHGDEIVVVDANFPADSTAMSTVMGEPIPLAGVNAARGVSNEHRRGVVANAGRVDYQVVEQRVLPIDIKQRTQPPAAHSVQFF